MTDYFAGPVFQADCAAILGLMVAARGTGQWHTRELRAAIEDCARHARAAGAPPERLIVELKAFLQSRAVAEVGTWFRDVLLDRAVSWAIQAYYGVRDT